MLALQRSGIKLTLFEASLVDSCLGQFSFSPRQKRSIDTMRAKYDEALKALNGDKPSLAAQAEAAHAELKRDSTRFRVGGASQRAKPAVIRAGGSNG